jgi:hypothetical protein
MAIASIEVIAAVLRINFPYTRVCAARDILASSVAASVPAKVLFGLFPARKTANLSSNEALRHK